MLKYTSIAVLLLLGACAGAPQPDTPSASPAVSPETVSVEPEVPVAPPAPPPIPKITSQQLLGQGGPWVIAKLGDPEFMRADRTANIWQYKNGHCVLNVFLYADENEQALEPRVLHFDARDNQGSNTDREHCLALLQD